MARPLCSERGELTFFTAVKIRQERMGKIMAPENTTLITEGKETLVVMNPRINHPIVASFLKEIAADVFICPCDDYEACEYEAN